MPPAAVPPAAGRIPRHSRPASRPPTTDSPKSDRTTSLAKHKLAYPCLALRAGDSRVPAAMPIVPVYLRCRPEPEAGQFFFLVAECSFADLGRTAPPSIESLVVKRVTAYVLRGFGPPDPPADADRPRRTPAAASAPCPP